MKGHTMALATIDKKEIDHRVAALVARMLTSKEPDVFQRGVRMIARSENLMNALRMISGCVAAVGGSQSAGLQ
jgi:hypothetical protein